MNLGFTIPQNKLNVSEVIDTYDTMIDVIDEITKVEYLSNCMENLETVKSLIDKGGVTPAIRSVFGQEFLSASMEVTAGDIGRAVAKGLVAFGKAVLGLISKIINFIKKFFSSKRKDIDGIIAKIEPVLGDMQNEPIKKGSTVNETLKLVNICNSHFKVKFDTIMPKQNYAEKEVIRREALSAFNKSVNVEAVVDKNYKLQFQPAVLNDTTLKELGYSTADKFRQVLNAINDSKQNSNTAITNLKNSNSAVERMVKALEGNDFHNEQSNQGSVQVAFVYAKIIFSDVAALVRADNMVNAIVSTCERHSRRFAKTDDDVSQDNSTAASPSTVTINNA